MFIFVFWVLLAIFLPRTESHDGCWLAGKTRGGKNCCYGDLRRLNDALARAAGIPPLTKVCLKHLRSIEKEDSRCSATFSETHSNKLTAIPRSLYEHIDTRGKKDKEYRPGSKWCYKCRASCYNQPGFPVAERRKVTFPIHNKYLYDMQIHIHIIPHTFFKFEAKYHLY